MKKVLDLTEETSQLFGIIYEAALKHKDGSSLQILNAINRLNALVRDDLVSIEKGEK